MMNAQQDQNRKPLIRWAGSKSRVLPHIIPNMPRFEGRYIEVFAGSACLFFARSYRESIISDANEDLISFYQNAIKFPEILYNKFAIIPRNKEQYYDIRMQYNLECNPFTKSVYFYYLNRNCFNGIYRTNNKGYFNVPFAGDRVARYPTKEEFILSAAQLSTAAIVSGDFQSVCLSNARSGDFVYLDPPYYVPNVRIFREYSSEHFGESDFNRLKETLAELDRRNVKFLLSYPTCSLSEELASNWFHRSFSIRRSISASLVGRKNAAEILISNYSSLAPQS